MNNYLSIIFLSNHICIKIKKVLNYLSTKLLTIINIQRCNQIINQNSLEDRDIDRRESAIHFLAT